MPYTDSTGRYETAHRTGHGAIIQNDAVQEKLQSFTVTQVDVDDIDVDAHTHALDTDPSEESHVTSFIGIDGSLQEVPVDDAYPADQIGFLQLATARLDLPALNDAVSGRFVNPELLEEHTTVDKYVSVLPSANITSKGAATVRDSWRSEIYELLQTRKVHDLSLFEAYQILLRYSAKYTAGEVDVARCPTPDCEATHLRVPITNPIECSRCGTTVYATDALRIHEKIAEHGSNQAALARLMQTLEHLIAAEYTIYLYYEAPERLSETMFLIDGPLAQFDVTAWLHAPLKHLYRDITAKQADAGREPPLVVGIEKSGKFADHAAHLESELETGDVISLDDNYLERYILSSAASSNGYGHNTYYGHRFIVQPTPDDTYVITLPKREQNGDLITDPAAYTELEAVMRALSEAQTHRYENALSPVTVAHEQASIPAQTGSRVLRLFAEDELTTTSNQR